ncbi:unnamed protein product [Prunus armeniaca]
MLQMEGEGEEEDIVCLDESFFIDDNYQLTTFTFGSQVIELLCLQSASTDFDLTGQLVWPGAMLLNDYLSKNAELLQGCTVLELGSGVGITGILCSRFCSKVVLTDHNEEVLKILKKNIELHASSENSKCCSGLVAEKLEWGNSEQIGHILQTMDSLVISEAVRCGMQINELVGTRSVVGNHKGVIFEVTLKKQDE